MASHSNGQATDNARGKESMEDLESKLRQCKDNTRNAERHLGVARERMMKLHTEIARLNNEVRTMEQEKASTGQVMWDYMTSFLPGGVARIEQQKQEQDRLYRERLAARRIKEAEEPSRLAEIQSCQILLNLHYRETSKIESEIRTRKEEAMRIFQETQETYFRELAKRMSEMSERETLSRTQAQQRTRYASRTIVCDHNAWWKRIEGRFTCSRCLTETRRFAFECPGCDKRACASCRDILKRGYGWT